jgi:nucleotide-binding universal stress UspA family protein
VLNRINHILVVVDPSARGRQSAVDKAALLAQSFDTSVELLVCDIDAARDDHTFALHARKTHPSKTQLLDLLDGLAAPMRAQGLVVTVRIIYGESLHDSLLAFVRGSTADIVVKDTHHHSFARRTFLMNTDWYLAHGSPVPLLLTKRKEWGQPPIVMAAVDPNRAKAGAAALDRQILLCAASLAGHLTGDSYVHSRSARGSRRGRHAGRDTRIGGRRGTRECVQVLPDGTLGKHLRRKTRMSSCRNGDARGMPDRLGDEISYRCNGHGYFVARQVAPHGHW